MRFWLWACLLLASSLVIHASDSNFEDNEFAEFEDEEVELEQPAVPLKEEVTAAPRTEKPKEEDDFDDDYGVVEEEENTKEPEETEAKVEPLKFADVPAHFRSNWASYQVEAVIIVIIIIFLVNYVIGGTQNSSLANNWFDNNRYLLEEQFALVGDDGLGENPTGGHLIRETDFSFLIWCSGRIGVNSLAIQLKTKKRQDLLSRVLHLFNPQIDRLTFKFELDQNELDSFVLCVGQKKPAARQFKEMLDLATFAPEKKNTAQFNLPASFALFSEQQEASYAILDNAVTNVFKRYEKAVEFIHISDQFSGPKPPEGETYTRMPDRISLLQFSFNLAELPTAEAQNEITQLVFHLVDRIRRVRLSKEAKSKSEKRRREVEEAFMKTTHQFRQEAAQARREEKTRERKQRLMDEEDPEKQRRLEKLELKREAKSKQPRMKQMKVKM